MTARTTRLPRLGPPDLIRKVRQRLLGTLTTANPPHIARDPDEPDELARLTSNMKLALSKSTFNSFTESLELIHNEVQQYTLPSSGPGTR